MYMMTMPALSPQQHFVAGAQPSLGKRHDYIVYSSVELCEFYGTSFIADARYQGGMRRLLSQSVGKQLVDVHSHNSLANRV
jgi:hypothetical protein